MVRGRRFTPLAVSMVLAAALAVTIPAASAATAAAVTVAPGAPGAPSYFDLARKDCLGTAAGRGSKVWYTVAGGVLSDVYEPTIDNTDVSTLQYVVTDGATFTDLQARDMTYTVAADPTGMACTVTSTDTEHGFRLVTTYITDPASDTVLMNTRLQALPGSGANLGRLHLYARLDAHVNGNGGGGSENAGANSGVVDASGVPVVFSTNTVTNATNRDYAVPTYMALAATSAQAASVGYAGTASDGLTQLDSRARPHRDLQLGARRPRRGHRERDPGPRPRGDARAGLRPDPGPVSVGRQGVAGPSVRPDCGELPARLGQLRRRPASAARPRGQPGRPLLPVGQRAEGERGQDLPGRDRRVPGQPVGPVGAGGGDRRRQAVVLRLLP